jgi:tRNA (cmo5U34)-methyltransferase
MFSFSNPEAVARYAEGPPKLTPGFHDLQKMTAILLAERLSHDARVLVVGAGGGLELKVFAERQPGWAFVGVDPSAEMLGLAAKTLGPLASRVAFHQGYVFDSPTGPFDGATSILTLHFIPRDERLRTLAAIRERLKPGAPLVVAHHSFPQSEKEKTLWLNRYAAFGAASGIPAEMAKNAATAVSANLPALSPEEDEDALRAAGFADISVFYIGFTFRGWVCTAA